MVVRIILGHVSLGGWIYRLTREIARSLGTVSERIFAKPKGEHAAKTVALGRYRRHLSIRASHRST